MRRYSLRDAKRLATGTHDWREAVWNRWLVGYLTPKTDLSTETGRASDSAPQQAKPDQRPEPASEPIGQKRDSGAAADSQRAGEIPGAATRELGLLSGDDVGNGRTSKGSGASEPSQRVLSLWARLDQILSEMDLVQSTLDRMSERQSAHVGQDRLQLRSVTDLLARLVETQERHTDSLVASTRALERLERRAMWSERFLRAAAAGGAAAGGVERSSEERFVATSGFPDTLVPVSGTQHARRAEESIRAAAESTVPLGGKLTDISLPTLLSMAELERWTGRLTLEARTHTVQVDLESGLLVGVLEDDSPTDAVEALHELLETRDGRFSFSPTASIVKTELAPMTVGTLLLRASHRRDELSRADVGS